MRNFSSNTRKENLKPMTKDKTTMKRLETIYNTVIGITAIAFVAYTVVLYIPIVIQIIELIKLMS